MDLQYAAPAEDVRDIVSIYYYATMPESFVGEERAAIAQVRHFIEGKGSVTMDNGESYCLEGPIIQGPTTGPVTYRSEGGAGRLVGAGLFPCGWQTLVGQPAHKFVNKVIPINPQFSEGLHNLMVAVAAAPDFAAMVVLLDEAARRLNSRVEPQVRRFVHMIDDWLVGSLSPDVSELYARSSLSGRQVERLTKHLYGVPPKMLARKYRALKAARQIKEQGELEDEAFYDQSHMIRELKHFTGRKPTAIQLDAEELPRLISERSKLGPKIHLLTSMT